MDKLQVNQNRLTTVVNITDQPKLIIVNSGKVKEVKMPYSGEVAVKTVKGCVKKYDIREEEAF